MGIKFLNKFLKNKCPDLFETINLIEYKNKTIAIDTSIYLYTYKTMYGSGWIKPFLKFLLCLQKNGIKCVFVFDSGAPIEKKEEQKQRYKNQKELEKK